MSQPENNSESIYGEDIRWDLSCFYKGLDDPQLDADLRSWVDGARAFSEAYKGKLSQTLPQAIRDFADLQTLIGKVASYLYLRFYLNTSDASVQVKIDKFKKETSLVEAECLEFFGHEVGELDQSVISAHAAQNQFVAKHLPWLDHIRIFRKHLLPEPIEAALTKRAQFGSGAWSEFFDEVEADLRFVWEESETTLTQMLHILTESGDSEVRAKALKTINDGFAGHFAKYSAQTLYMVAGSKEIEVRERGYKHPMESRNKSSHLPDSAVEALHKAVTENAGPLAQRYYKLKANLLGLQKLRWSDRNAPMPFVDNSKVSWEKAMKIVLAAYQSFSPTLAGLIEKTIKDKHIDAPAVPGKRGGAFNSSAVLPDGTPISMTFLNFIGSNRDVMTLAHELGHGVHGLLAGEAQGTLLQGAPIALCETASVFGEMTTFNYLKKELVKRGDLKAMLALIMSKLDDMMNTAVRQIGFSNFERRLHGWDPASNTWKGSRKMSVEELDALWLETAYELYGQPGEIFTYENTEHLWAYISHFHNPFYVYGYAFGELLTQSLYAARMRIGDGFEPLYLDMLRAGGSKDAVELLKPFGLNPTDPGFWAEGIKISMEAMVDEAEKLARHLGLVT